MSRALSIDNIYLSNTALLLVVILVLMVVVLLLLGIPYVVQEVRN